ncbi:MAG TPA: hypothetical protein VF691_22345 [Cytophagaceae bacterium]|jgi:alpha-N-arabinofuranosidase
MIESNPWAFEYYYKIGDEPFKKIYHTQSKFLATEVAGGFVGNYFGLYATGNGKKCKSPAHFDWFNYEILK